MKHKREGDVVYGIGLFAIFFPSLDDNTAHVASAALSRVKFCPDRRVSRK
jgi:hypothetical protein